MKAMCLRCGRKLTNKRSVELGYGPGCFKKIQIEDKKAEMEYNNQENINVTIKDIVRRKENLKVTVNQDRLRKLIGNDFDISGLENLVIASVKGSYTLRLLITNYAIEGRFFKDEELLYSTTLKDPFNKDEIENVLIGAYFNFKEMAMEENKKKKERL